MGVTTSMVLVSIVPNPPIGLGQACFCISRGLSGALWGVLAMWTAEIYPTTMRATAMGLSSFSGRIAGILTSLIVGGIDVYVAIAVLSGVCFLGAVFAFVIRVDTTHKQLAEVPPESSIEPLAMRCFCRGGKKYRGLEDEQLEDVHLDDDQL